MNTIFTSSFVKEYLHHQVLENIPTSENFPFFILTILKRMLEILKLILICWKKRPFKS